jgi:hypothetical protein
MSQMKCKCSKLLNIPDPTFEIFNGQHQSMIIFNHALMNGKCPDCGFAYMGFIQNFDIGTLQFSVGVMPVPEDLKENLIDIASPDFDVRKLIKV